MTNKPLVLVTGATGHIGFATLLALLKTDKYRARVSSRKLSAAKALGSHPLLAPYSDSLEFVEVPDFLAPGAFDSVIQGVEYVLHIASPIPILDGSAKGHFRDLYVNPAIHGTVGILESAVKAPSVKRVVITSSVAILSPKEPGTPAGPTDFSPIPDIENLGDNPWIAYRASKILAHEASVKFMEENKPQFDLIHIMPSYVQGANHLVTDAKDVHNGSNDAMVDICLGIKSEEPRPTCVVLVDDVAAVEVAALDPNKAKTGDHFIASLPTAVDWSDAPAIAKRLFPDAVEKGVLPLGGSRPINKQDFDVSYTTEKLGVEFRGFEDMVKSLIGQYVELASK